jgi:type VI secretion system secreted protein VgrG
MAAYSQASLPMRIATALPEDTLLLEGFTAQEGISQPFLLQLDLLSEDPEIDANEMLRSPVCLSVELPDGETRHIHGLISQFVQLGTRTS